MKLDMVLDSRKESELTQFSYKEHLQTTSSLCDRTERVYWKSAEVYSRSFPQQVICEPASV